ncbi:YcfA family protein [Leptolyngbya sp. NIES-3755]|nr:YcfA family protein [Leptolyngbya sp. NIES-3755]
MGSALPVMSGREVVRVFESLGWEAVRQTGSHIIMTKDEEMVTLSIPDHREVAKGTLRSLIRTAGLTVEEFVAAKQLVDCGLKHSRADATDFCALFQGYLPLLISPPPTKKNKPHRKSVPVAR